MEKRISLTEARGKLSEIVNNVQYGRDTYIIVKQGKPSVALVPLEVLERWREERENLFRVIDEVQTQNEGVDADNLMAVILQSQQAVRSAPTTTPADI